MIKLDYKDKNSEILDIYLKDIISLIENIDNYHWKLIWIYGVSAHIHELPFIKGMYMIDFESHVNNSRKGFSLSSQELIRLSTIFEYITEFIIIGDKKEYHLQKLDSDIEMKLRYRYFIELVDSSYWEITSKDEIFINNAKKKFEYREEFDAF